MTDEGDDLGNLSSRAKTFPETQSQPLSGAVPKRTKHRPPNLIIPNSDTEEELTVDSPDPNTGITLYPRTEATPSPRENFTDAVNFRRRTAFPYTRTNPLDHDEIPATTSPERGTAVPSKRAPPKRTSPKGQATGQRSIENAFGGLYKCSCGILVDRTDSVKCNDKSCSVKYFHFECVEVASCKSRLYTEPLDLTDRGEQLQTNGSVMLVESVRSALDSARMLGRLR